MTEIFDLADRIVEESADADPIMATFVGVSGRDDRITDYSVAACDARAEQARGWLEDLDGLEPTGEPDRVAAAVIRERLGARLAMHAAGEHLRDINVLGSPVQNIRDILTLMPTETDDDWRNVAARLEAAPAALDQVRSAFEDGIARGVLPARVRSSARRERQRSAPGSRPRATRRRRRGSTASSRATRAATPRSPTGSRPVPPPPRRRTPASRRGSPRSTHRRPSRPMRSGASATSRWRGCTAAPTSTPRRPTPGAGRTSVGSPAG